MLTGFSASPSSGSRSARLALVALVAVAVTSCTAKPPEDTSTDSTASTSFAATAPWRQEVLELPPRFAPDMPRGVDELRFAPGMFDAAAEDYWSYAFVMRLDEELAGVGAVTTLLEQLYDGLLASVGRGKSLAMEGDVATVALKATDGECFRGQVDLIDAFVTGERVRVHLEVETRARAAGGTAVRVAASPQPAEHPVWSDIREQLATIATD